jgi:DNA mismatch repair protein MutL
MSKINILTKEVYNKIAAGEVVEKPASVVKELVENSIDAGATSINIEILDGGITQIKISDNGCGIEYDDFDKVFVAHATSKVKNIDDLGKIGTLGFRGEALSSIASVSNITLSSKTENSSEGYQVKVIGGEMGEIMPIGATTGTYFVISDLFFNIPARKKFLRKPKLEENDITNYVARLILANPNISIKYSADNKIVYHSFGTGLYDAIYTIYGKSIVDNIFEFSFDRGDFKFSGYLGKPTYSKPNRTYQTLIINGRYVINQTIATAINRAFDNFMMKGSFPFFVLNLELPLDKVDVNVHPNKLEVKFEDSNSIFGMVYSEVLNILYNLNTTKKINTEEELIVDSSKLTVLDNIGSQYKEEKQENAEDNEIKEVCLTDNVEYERNKIDREIDDFKKNIESSDNDGAKFIPFVSDNAFDFKIAQNKPVSQSLMDKKEDEQISIIDSAIDNSDEENNSIQSQLFENNNFKIIGTLFDTYILIEQGNSMLVIDQHAGHERILFDKFNIELNQKNVAIQPLIVPYVIETNYNESAFINENMETLSQMGFEIVEFGKNSFKVSSTPMLFENFDLEKFFANILSDLDNKLILSKNDTIKEYIAKKACRSAVKGNDKLSSSEINELINQINQPGQVLLCPHGRPIVVDIDKKEIEKWFKRIV